MNYKKKLEKILGRKNYIKLRSVKQAIRAFAKKIEWNRKYKADLKEYCKQNRREEFKFEENYAHKVLGEWEEEAGGLGAYFWQDLWAAKHIYQRNPAKHYDIGSSMCFIGHLASFRMGGGISNRCQAINYENSWHSIYTGRCKRPALYRE